MFCSLHQEIRLQAHLHEDEEAERQQVWEPQNPTQRKEPLPQTLPSKQDHILKSIIWILFNDECEEKDIEKGGGQWRDQVENSHHL